MLAQVRKHQVEVMVAALERLDFAGYQWLWSERTPDERLKILKTYLDYPVAVDYMAPLGDFRFEDWANLPYAELPERIQVLLRFANYNGGMTVEGVQHHAGRFLMTPEERRRISDALDSELKRFAA
jgi:hypothetical protein